jgi:hypothetical protein
MSTPDELERAVKALTDMRDAARDGTPVTDPNEWEFDELTRILAAFQFLLSERAELLAAVERLRVALERIVTAVCYADPPQNFARAGDEPNLCHVARVPVDFIAEARAALTTGEEK